MRCYNLQRIGAAVGGARHRARSVRTRRGVHHRAQAVRQPIADFQGLQWMLADMHIQLSAHASSCTALQRAGRTAIPDKLEGAAAKVHAAETGDQASPTRRCRSSAQPATRCDLPIERMVRDARMFTIGGGTAQVQRNLIADEILKRRGPRRAASAPHRSVGELGWRRDPARSPRRCVLRDRRSTCPSAASRRWPGSTSMYTMARSYRSSAPTARARLRCSTLSVGCSDRVTSGRIEFEGTI